MISIGKKAPQFSGINQNNETIKLKDYLGKKVALYFYPHDMTPGCTAQACSIRDNYATLLQAGYMILGISSDNVKQHQKFIAKYKLPFDLIADEDLKIHDKYNVWQLKKFMGREFMGTIRTTFIIDEKGIITDIIDKVDTKNHADQLLNLL